MVLEPHGDFKFNAVVMLCLLFIIIFSLIRLFSNYLYLFCCFVVPDISLHGISKVYYQFFEVRYV